MLLGPRLAFLRGAFSTGIEAALVFWGARGLLSASRVDWALVANACSHLGLHRSTSGPPGHKMPKKLRALLAYKDTSQHDTSSALPHCCEFRGRWHAWTHSKPLILRLLAPHCASAAYLTLPALGRRAFISVQTTAPALHRDAPARRQDYGIVSGAVRSTEAIW